ncbi:hypothetical protein HZC07_02425, partial [Candidatus Micrarchaeota archaeon]|nr:hypothetical protein [Candidatus Micrarchaeota archaeon]
KSCKTIRLNEKIVKTLQRAGIETDREVAGEGLYSDRVPYSELTEAERGTIAAFQDVDTVLALGPARGVNICTTVTTRTGRDMTGRIMGFYDHSTGEVTLQRELLADWASAQRTYTHERGHEKTGAKDPEDGFRAFFEYNLAALVDQEIARMREDPTYRVTIEAFASWDIERAARLEVQLAKAQTEVAKARRELEEALRQMELAEGKLDANPFESVSQTQPKGLIGKRLDPANSISISLDRRLIQIEAMAGMIENDMIEKLEDYLRPKKWLRRLFEFLTKKTYRPEMEFAITETSVRVIGQDSQLGCETGEMHTQRYEVNHWRAKEIFREIRRDQMTSRQVRRALTRIKETRQKLMTA